MGINWTIVLIIIIALVATDKIITVANIKAVEKNFPDNDPLSIEKNPLAKNFFIQFGLYWGSILYFFFSIGTFFIAFLLLKWCIGLLNVANAPSISLYILFIFYSFVIMNNIYMLLKFSKVIP